METPVSINNATMCELTDSEMASLHGGGFWSNVWGTITDAINGVVDGVKGVAR